MYHHHNALGAFEGDESKNDLYQLFKYVIDKQIAIYQSEDGEAQLDVQIENETVWLTQQQMLELFDSSPVNVTEHINYVFDKGELNGEATSRKIRLVRREGDRQVGRNIDHYNLGIIIVNILMERKSRGITSIIVCSYQFEFTRQIFIVASASISGYGLSFVTVWYQHRQDYH